MLQAVLQDICGPQGNVEASAQQRWSSLLQLPDDARQTLCTDLVAYFKAQESCEPPAPPIPTKTAFADVFCAALFAIHANLAAPLAWHSAKESRLRSCLSLPSAASPADAETLVHFCENHLLLTPITAVDRFRCLLNYTGMGVPLLSLVLDAYGTAVTSVLAKPNEQSGDGVLDRCLKRLRKMADHFSQTEVETPHLTIVHPILLHVARVGGRLQEALEIARQPVRVVQPVLTGVGLADYVAYYCEVALLHAACGDYAAAFYALTPVHSLPPGRGLSDRLRGRTYGAGGDGTGADVYFASLKAQRVERQGGAAPYVSASASAAAAAARSSASSAVVTPSAKWYPWYRPQCVSATHICLASGHAADGTAEDSVEWKLFLVPTMAELARDEKIRAWATRLSLVLLCVAFGGGCPRTVLHTNPDALHADAKEVDWRGTYAAGVEGQHLCFPHPLFQHLSATTLVSLPTLLTGAAKSFSDSTQVCYDLLRAVVQRDGAAVRAIVSESAPAVFAADLTLPFAEALVGGFMARHILLDVARVYSRVPLRLVLDRTRNTAAHAEQQQQQHTREVLRLLAQLCASGELLECTVDGAAVASVVAADGFEKRDVAEEKTLVTLALPSASQLVQLCAGIVSPQTSFSAEGLKQDAAPVPSITNASLFNMLTQMEQLNRALEVENSIVNEIM